MPTWEPTWPPAPHGTTTLAGRIASLRSQRGWTQQQLADRLGVTRVAVSHLEGGINSPDARTVALLAGAFHLEPHDLVGGTDYPAAKADRLPLVVARHTEVEHQLALMERDLVWVEGPDAAVADRRAAEAVRQRWRTTLAKLAATVLDPAEAAALDTARRRLAADPPRVTASGLRFAVVAPSEATDPDLFHELLAVWVAVTDAGGSVGFAPPAPVDQVTTTLDLTLQQVASGRDALGILRDGAGAAVGMGLLVSRVDLFAHWRTVLRLMVRPDHQGTGAGRLLVEGLHDLAHDLGLEHLHLSVRGDEGLEPFYERFGYRVVGTHPGAVRLGPTDTRDEVFMLAVL